MSSRVLRTSTLLGLTLAAAGCGSGGAADDALTGEVREDGSSTLYPVAAAVAEEFRRVYPEVRVTVGVSGTGGGIRRLCADQVDLANASRAMTPNEAVACRAGGVDVVEVPLARDGITLVTSPRAEWLDCLTLAELRALWRPDSAVERWSDLRPGFPDREVHLYGAGAASGTFDYFTEQVVGEARASRIDYQASEDDNVIVTGVADDPDALGFFGYAYYAANAERLRSVAVDGGAGCVRPSLASIGDGSYVPLGRTLYLYLNRASLDRPAVALYVDFLLERAERLVAESGYRPLAAERYAESRATLARLTGPAA